MPACPPPGSANPPTSAHHAVVLLHGYGACGDVHRADAASLVAPDARIVLPDAPGHGSRDDGRLQRIAMLPDDARRAAILAIAREWQAELAAVAAACRAAGAVRVGLCGISMGGFAALASYAESGPFDAVAALLAGPDLIAPDRLERGSQTGTRPPLLLGIAGRDAAVPPEPARAFARRCGAELHEYPESEHLMREVDWRDLWSRTGAFLRRHLTAT